MSDYDNFVTIFSDASLKDKQGGFGGVVLSGNIRKEFSGQLKQEITNSTNAEAMALCNVIFLAKSEGLFHGRKFASIQLDSMGLIARLKKSGIARLTKNAVGNGKIRKHFHGEMPCEATKQICKMLLPFDRVYLKHIKAHDASNGKRSELNRACDLLAKSGRESNLEVKNECFK